MQIGYARGSRGDIQDLAPQLAALTAAAAIRSNSGWVPERMAARSLRMPKWESGQRLMQAGNAAAFAGVLAADRLASVNRDTLAACRKQATRAEKAVRCAIEIEADGQDGR